MAESGNPIQELLNLRDRMNRLFEDSMGRFAPAEDQAGLGGFVPPVDIFEDAERIVLWVELPGVPRDAVELAVEEGKLVIRGERRLDESLRREDFHRVERSYGRFERTFQVPQGVDTGSIGAEMRQGVLEVVLPRSSPERPHVRVDVK